MKNTPFGWAPVSHAYNPSYSGGRDQEDHGSHSSGDPTLKKPNTKNGWQSGWIGIMPAWKV
jgi:hypothetical protein